MIGALKVDPVTFDDQRRRILDTSGLKNLLAKKRMLHEDYSIDVKKAIYGARTRDIEIKSLTLYRLS